MDFELTDQLQGLPGAPTAFMDEHVLPAEEIYEQQSREPAIRTPSRR